MSRAAAIILCAFAASSCGSDAQPTSPSLGPFTFFVTSTTSVTGNLGGLRGADATCQRLATAAGHGRRTWRAYLSAERDPDSGQSVDARSRIGSGPWFNTYALLVAKDLSELHARRGDAALFVDEHGRQINGQWPGSPRPVEHDILT